MSFGKRLREARTARALTQEALGKALGLVPQTISKWERDECLPDASLLLRVADALQVPLDWLFERVEGSWEEAEEALLRWFGSLTPAKRTEGMEKLLDWVVRFLVGGRDEPEDGLRTARPMNTEEDHLAILLLNRGLLIRSTGHRQPLFAYFRESEEGWGALLKDPEELQPLWEALGDEEIRRSLLRCLRETAAPHERQDFISAFSLQRPEETLSRLEGLQLLTRRRADIDGAEAELLQFSPDPKLLALLLLGEALFGEGNWRSYSYVCDSSRIAPPLIRPEPGKAASLPEGLLIQMGLGFRPDN